MSAVERCGECGGLFGSLPRGVCASCLDRREADFRLVRDWLRDHNGAPIAVVSDATGVDEGLIVRFIREGRVEVLEPGSDPALARDREEEERRAELVRQLADAPRMGTSVNAAGEHGGRAPEFREPESRGMRARRT